MNLIVLSHLYPKSNVIYYGTFVKEQVQALESLVEGTITVISPVPWSPRFLWFKKKWKEYGQTERINIEDEIKVYYPRYLLFPGKSFSSIEGFFIYVSVRSLIKKLIKTNKSNTVLHSHTILPDGLAGVLIKRKFKIPHICTIHGSDINKYPFKNKLSMFLTKYALGNCDRIITVSRKLKEKTLSILNELNDISVIYNGANHKVFKPISRTFLEQKFKIEKNNNKIIMFVGNLKTVKGCEYLIIAFSELLKVCNRDDIMLYFIGDGDKKRDLVKMTKSLGVDKKVFFLGSKPHDQIPLWLNISDIFVLPSISEGFPTIIPEAMMCGVPVIASDVGGISEIITTNKTGFLTKPGNIEEIVSCIKLLLDNENIRQQIIETAKNESKRYTWENNALECIRKYNEVL